MFDWKIKAKSDLHQTNPIVKLRHHRPDHYHHQQAYKHWSHTFKSFESQSESTLLCGKPLRNTILSTRTAFFFRSMPSKIWFVCFLFVYLFISIFASFICVAPKFNGIGPHIWRAHHKPLLCVSHTSQAVHWNYIPPSPPLLFSLTFGIK